MKTKTIRAIRSFVEGLALGAIVGIILIAAACGGKATPRITITTLDATPPCAAMASVPVHLCQPTGRTPSPALLAAIARGDTCHADAVGTGYMCYPKGSGVEIP